MPHSRYDRKIFKAVTGRSLLFSIFTLMKNGISAGNRTSQEKGKNTIVTSDIGHGPLRCLFTADEEVGMYGASSLEESTLNSKYPVSLDGEQKGLLYRGCAGSITVHTLQHINELGE